MLRADSVTFAYPGARRARFGRGAKPGEPPAVCDVSLTIARGEIVGLLGPNGSGKTTLLRVLAGLLVPQSGHVWLDGQALSALGRIGVARRIALVPQETISTFDYRVIDMVLMGRYPHLGPLALEGPDDGTTLGEFLERGRYSRPFVEQHLVIELES